MFIRILLFVIPILSSSLVLPEKKPKQIRAGMVMTSLAGNKRICLGGTGRNNTMQVMLTENTALCQKQVFPIKVNVAYHCCKCFSKKCYLFRRCAFIFTRSGAARRIPFSGFCPMPLRVPTQTDGWPRPAGTFVRNGRRPT